MASGAAGGGEAAFGPCPGPGSNPEAAAASVDSPAELGGAAAAVGGGVGGLKYPCFQRTSYAAFHASGSRWNTARKPRLHWERGAMAIGHMHGGSSRHTSEAPSPVVERMASSPGVGSEGSKVAVASAAALAPGILG